MPPLTPEEVQALLNYLLTVGQQQQAPLNMNFGQVPGDPDVLDFQKDAANYLQDRNQLSADPFSIVGAGAGSYDAAAFEPEVEMTPVQRPGEQLLNYYMSSNEGTIERMIAEHIQAGGTASSAFAEINAILQSQEPEIEEVKARLLASIPTTINQQTLQPEPDYNSVLKTAQDLEKAVATDPVGNYQDESGQWFDRKETPSKVAQQYQEAGLPLPTQQYNVEDVMGPEWQQATGGIYDQEAFRKALTEALVDPLKLEADRARTTATSASAQPMTDRYAAANAQPAFAAARAADPIAAINAQPAFADARAAGDPLAFMKANLAGAGGPSPIMKVNLKGLGPQEVAPTRGRSRGQVPSTQTANAADKAYDDYIKARRNVTKQQQTLFNEDYYRNQGRVQRARDEGRTPLTDAMLARRMAALAAGLSGGYLPGA